MNCINRTNNCAKPNIDLLLDMSKKIYDEEKKLNLTIEKTEKVCKFEKNLSIRSTCNIFLCYRSKLMRRM